MTCFFRCFLSDESKQVATIIKSMLQLAFELRLCFQSLGDTCDLSVNQLSNLQYLINFSQVFSQFHTSNVVWFTPWFSLSTPACKLKSVQPIWWYICVAFQLLDVLYVQSGLRLVSLLVNKPLPLNADIELAVWSSLVDNGIPLFCHIVWNLTVWFFLVAKIRFCWLFTVICSSSLEDLHCLQISPCHKYYLLIGFLAPFGHCMLFNAGGCN
jgi:hypothetical protein